jgi:uncharacterized protein (TIGR03437 family)
LSLLVTVLAASEFQTGQAARAVLGQSSFSSHDTGIRVASLSYADHRLYATEALDSQRFRLNVFDLNKIPDPRSDLSPLGASRCALCGFMPISQVDLPAAPVSPAVAEYGDIRIVADSDDRQVLIWRGLNQSPDVVLRGFLEPVSVAYDGGRLFVGDALLHRVLVWNSLPTENDQPADVILGGASSDVLGPETIRVPAALASDGDNLYVADPGSRRILVFTPGDTQLPANAVVNAASLAYDLLAPGTLAYISGTNLSDVTAAAPDGATEPLSRKLGGVQIFFNGVALPILSVSPSEIHTQLPYGMGDSGGASIYVRTEHADGHVTITNALGVKTAPATPGLFAFGGKEPRDGLVLHSDGTPVTASRPAQPGEKLTAWATGFGALSNNIPPEEGKPYDGPAENELVNSISALVDGHPAEVASAGLPTGAIGIYEVRIVLPANLPTASSTRLTVTQNGYISNTVTFSVGSSIVH